MEFEKYKGEALDKHNRKKRLNRKIFAFFLFSLVIAIIFFSTFNGGIDLTGKVIGNISSNNSMEIKTSLNIPEVELDNSYEKIAFSLNGNSFIYLDNKKISLDEAENKIILSGFRGKIELNENVIKSLEGKISEIKLNNLPINLQEGGKIKFSLSPASGYTSFEIDEGVYLKNLVFITSGNISLNEDFLKLNSEKINLENYFGGIKIIEKQLVFEGFVEKLTIEGNSRKIILSSG